MTYLQHLLADIAAARASPPSPGFHPNPESGPLENAESYLAAPQYTFAYWTGIQKDALPPPEKLKTQEMLILVPALVELWQSINIQADFPENIPVEIKYNAIRESWNDEVTVIPGKGEFGRIHYDFCTGYAPECVLGKYCSCLEFWEEETGD